MRKDVVDCREEKTNNKGRLKFTKADSEKNADTMGIAAYFV